MVEHGLTWFTFQTVYLFVVELDSIWVLQPQLCVGLSQPKRDSNRRPSVCQQ